MGGVGKLLLWSLRIRSLRMVVLEWSYWRAFGMVPRNGDLGMVTLEGSWNALEMVVLEDSWNALAMVLLEGRSWKAPGHNHVIGS